MVPLMEGMGLGIAVTSYAGTMNCGFNADPDIVPDADVFVEQIRASYARVAAAAKLSEDSPPAGAGGKGKPIRTARSPKTTNGSAAGAAH